MLSRAARGFTLRPLHKLLCVSFVAFKSWLFAMLKTDDVHPSAVIMMNLTKGLYSHSQLRIPGILVASEICLLCLRQFKKTKNKIKRGRGGVPPV